MSHVCSLFTVATLPSETDHHTALHIKPVSFACELFVILERGRKANLCIARFTQEKGAKSSFERVLEAMESLLRAKGFLVEDKVRARDMARCLGGK